MFTVLVSCFETLKKNVCSSAEIFALDEYIFTALKNNIVLNLIEKLVSPIFIYGCEVWEYYTVKTLCIGTDRSQQTVQTKIRLLLKKQSDQGLRCLPFHQHLLDALMQCYSKHFYF